MKDQTKYVVSTVLGLMVAACGLNAWHQSSANDIRDALSPSTQMLEDALRKANQ